LKALDHFYTSFPTTLTGTHGQSAGTTQATFLAIYQQGLGSFDAAINTGLLFDLAPQQIAGCALNPDQCGGTGNCFGGTAEVAFDYLAHSEGMFEEF
jgi:hypothetical protein